MPSRVVGPVEQINSRIKAALGANVRGTADVASGPGGRAALQFGYSGYKHVHVPNSDKAAGPVRATDAEGDQDYCPDGSAAGWPKAPWLRHR